MLVNLDRGIQDVTLEARWLRHLNLQVPQIAQAVLLQEGKFALYHQKLSHALEVSSSKVRSFCTSVILLRSTDVYDDSQRTISDY